MKWVCKVQQESDMIGFAPFMCTVNLRCLSRNKHQSFSPRNSPWKSSGSNLNINERTRILWSALKCGAAAKMQNICSSIGESIRGFIIFTRRMIHCFLFLPTVIVQPISVDCVISTTIVSISTSSSYCAPLWTSIQAVLVDKKIFVIICMKTWLINELHHNKHYKSRGARPHFLL